MNREIKFRAWDEKHKLMVWNPRLDVTAHPDGSVDYRAGTKTLMQYTGLKDKNGKEIYEGDVLRLGEFEVGDGKNIGEVKYFGDDGYPAFDIQGNDMETNALSYLIADGEVEIIGNIYENPNLIRSLKNYE